MTYAGLRSNYCPSSIPIRKKPIKNLVKNNIISFVVRLQINYYVLLMMYLYNK